MTAAVRRRGALAALGLGVGLASTLFGIGGGLIMVPVLHLAFGYELKRAVGTSLVAIIGIALIGVTAESWVSPGSIRWVIAAEIAIGAIVGARLGAALLDRLPTEVLRWIFTLFLIGVIVRLLLFGGGQGGGVEALSRELALVACLITGVVTGITSAFFGIGGGVVVVPVLLLLFADIDFHTARATSLAMMVPTATFGAIFHKKLANLETEALPFLVPTAFIGAVLGVFLAADLSSDHLRVAFAFFLMYAVVQLQRGRKTARSSASNSVARPDESS